MVVQEAEAPHTLYKRLKHDRCHGCAHAIRCQQSTTHVTRVPMPSHPTSSATALVLHLEDAAHGSQRHCGGQVGHTGMQRVQVRCKDGAQLLALCQALCRDGTGVDDRGGAVVDDTSRQVGVVDDTSGDGSDVSLGQLGTMRQEMRQHTSDTLHQDAKHTTSAPRAQLQVVGCGSGVDARESCFVERLLQRHAATMHFPSSFGRVQPHTRSVKQIGDKDLSMYKSKSKSTSKSQSKSNNKASAIARQLRVSHHLEKKEEEEEEKTNTESIWNWVGPGDIEDLTSFEVCEFVEWSLCLSPTALQVCFGLVVLLSLQRLSSPCLSFVLCLPLPCPANVPSRAKSTVWGVRQKQLCGGGCLGHFREVLESCQVRARR